MSPTKTSASLPISSSAKQHFDGTDPGLQPGQPGAAQAMACRACVNRRAFLTTACGLCRGFQPADPGAAPTPCRLAKSSYCTAGCSPPFFSPLRLLPRRAFLNMRY